MDPLLLFLHVAAKEYTNERMKGAQTIRKDFETFNLFIGDDNRLYIRVDAKGKECVSALLTEIRVQKKSIETYLLTISRVTRNFINERIKIELDHGF